MSTKLCNRLTKLLGKKYRGVHAHVWLNGDRYMGFFCWSDATERHCWWGGDVAEGLPSAVVVSLCGV